MLFVQAVEKALGLGRELSLGPLRRVTNQKASFLCCFRMDLFSLFLLCLIQRSFSFAAVMWSEPRLRGQHVLSGDGVHCLPSGWCLAEKAGKR